MIIRTSVPPKKEEIKKPVVNEEVKVLDKEIIQTKKKNKKITPAPVVEETSVAVEEKTEDEDLSQWLKEHTED
jgi:hypothetical protein